MAIWLLKTEPSDYSYEDLERDGTTMWDGVANAMALQKLRLMREGDTALIYHTGDVKAWVGVADVVRGAYVNPGLDDPKMAVCDVRARRRVAHPVTLSAIKVRPELSEWELVRIARLSVVPVSDAQWQTLQEMAREEL